MFSNTKKPLTPLTEYQKFAVWQRQLAKEKLEKIDEETFENMNDLWENNKDKLIKELRDDMDVVIEELSLRFAAMDISS
jgi:hypothetical protein